MQFPSRTPFNLVATIAQQKRDVATRAFPIGSARELLSVAEWLRYFIDAGIVIPAAKRLPLRVALAAADATGWLGLLTPGNASRETRAEITASTGAVGWPALKLAARRLAAGRRRLVYRWRIAEGLENAADWTVIETGTEQVRALQAEGTSFILATGHFTSGVGRLFRDALVPERVTVASEQPFRFSPYDLRRRARSPQDRAPRERIEIESHWLRNYDWARAKPTNAQGAMLETLASPGGIVSIYVDAPWAKPNSYVRPFAGFRARSFALGAARTARLAQCPIVPGIVTLGDAPRTVHIECGPLIMPPGVEDTAADRHTIDQVLDWLELAVARHPVQYADSGAERHWDAAAGAWVDA